MKRSEIARLDREICGTVWTSPHTQRLMDALSYDIGPRPAGSKAFREAARLVGDVLRRIGASDVHTEPVPVFAWRDAPSRLELLAPHRRVYECIQHVHTASAKITAPLLDGGAASEEQLDRLGHRVRGKILLVHGRETSVGKFVPLQQRLRNVLERGAVGVIVRNRYPGVGPGIERIGISDDFAIPVLGVSCEDGRELASFVRRSRPRVRAEAAGKSTPARCRNLVADLGPTRPVDEVIVLSAHLDSFHLAPGSFDNLSGVVTLIEIARAIAPLRSKFKRRLRLIAFTGEEYGFIGSKSYVRRHAKDLDRVRFIFNMDCLFPSTADGVAVTWSPAMRDYIARALRQTTCDVDVRNLFCMSSDYLPFILAGIPAARPADWKSSFPTWSHTRMDTPDKVPPEWIRMNAMTYAQLLVRMLLDPKPLPAKRKRPQEIRDLTAQASVGEALRSYEFDVAPSGDGIGRERQA